MITTEKLFLRPINSDDKHAIFEYRSDKEANKYQGWIPKTIIEVDEFIAKLATENNQPGTWFQLAIIEKEREILVGDLGIHFLKDDPEQVELGYTLNKKYQGLGYATEAVKATVNYLFTVLKKHRITASVDPRNSPSFKILEKLGFRKDAHFVESLQINNEWVDDVIYALLAREWR